MSPKYGLCLVCISPSIVKIRRTRAQSVGGTNEPGTCPDAWASEVVVSSSLPANNSPGLRILRALGNTHSRLLFFVSRTRKVQSHARFGLRSVRMTFSHISLNPRASAH